VPLGRDRSDGGRVHPDRKDPRNRCADGSSSVLPSAMTGATRLCSLERTLISYRSALKLYDAFNFDDREELGRHLYGPLLA
jgi:hypothetical protein